MSKFTWQRSHGADVVAEVRADGRGRWKASAWLRSNPTAVARSPKWLISRNSACAKADALARQTFEHACDLDACGDWLPFEVGAPNV